ncbi:hypothetical protein RND81_07G112400 [Saponaria officinalis]|uniref:Fe2OG dioxygenase domain-containing protein n=1 Tax=Saponaria officinalis TaxID=3572 RepID=A0AAW1JM80_SAPOF
MDDDSGIDENTVSYMDTIVIDYSMLTSNNPTQEEQNELHKFKSALSSWACFQLINHGIPTSFLAELRQASRQFFTLPIEEKKKYTMPEGGDNGYDGKDVTDTDNQEILDWNEGLNLTVFPTDRLKLEFWPQQPSIFKTLMQEYAEKLGPIFEALLKKVLQVLKVDEEKFKKQYGKNKEMNVRLNYYPISSSKRRGLGSHADFSAMTLLLQDEEGLQVLKDGQWFTVPVISDALFLNLGDPLEIMSNGVLKSAVHRVITSSRKSRLSVATFWDTDRNCDIRPLDDLITFSSPQRYETVSLQHYRTQFFKNYQSEQRLIDTVTIHY